jgi:hypothetical protein
MILLFFSLFFNIGIFDWQSNRLSDEKLYIKCGNILTIPVAEKLKNEKLTYQATNASIQKGKKYNEILVVPTSSQAVTVTIKFKEAIVFSQKFITQTIPMPKVLIMQNNRPVSAQYGLKLPLASILFKAEADEKFAEALPADARYKCAKTTVKLLRAGKVLNKFVCSESTEKLSELKKLALPDDILEVEVTEVQRMNFEGKLESVAINKSVFKIPLHKN